MKTKALSEYNRQKPGVLLSYNERIKPSFWLAQYSILKLKNKSLLNDTLS